MDTIIGLCIVGAVLLILWLLAPSSSGEVHRCEKCGFTTTSKLEAIGHEKLENAHKVIKQ
jgi:hypothetical protein